MSPASNRRGRNQMAIGARLSSQAAKGEVISECAIQTTKGVRVADAARASPEFIARFAFETPYSVAPEVCAEVLSPSNSSGEITEKLNLYFNAGATEVWLCAEDGTLAFRDKAGVIPNSKLFPDFPSKI